MRTRSSAKALSFAVSLVLGATVVLGVAGCTERPSSFPPCLDPYDNFSNDCPALDAGALDAEALDEDGAPSADGNAGDGGDGGATPEATALDAAPGDTEGRVDAR